MTLTDAERERLVNMRDACQAAIDGRPWEVQNTVGEWRDPDANSVPLNYWMARAKPLPSAPVVRDWTPEEMIGKTVKSKCGGIYMITGVYEGHCEIGKSTYLIANVKKYFTQPDDTPCGTVAQTPDPRA